MRNLSYIIVLLCLVFLSVLLIFNAGIGGGNYKIKAEWEKDDRELEVEIEGKQIDDITYDDVMILNPWTKEAIQGRIEYERDHDEIEVDIYSPNQVPCELLVVVGEVEHKVRLRHAPAECLDQKKGDVSNATTQQADITQNKPSEDNVRSTLNGQPLCQSCHKQKGSFEFSSGPHPAPHNQSCSTCHKI